MESFIGQECYQKNPPQKGSGGAFAPPELPMRNFPSKADYVELFRTRLINLKDEYAGSVDGWKRSGSLKPDPWWTFAKYSSPETHIKRIIEKT
jgi:hypothetical protein